MTPFDRINIVMPWVSDGSQEELREVAKAMADLVNAADHALHALRAVENSPMTASEVLLSMALRPFKVKT